MPPGEVDDPHLVVPPGQVVLVEHCSPEDMHMTLPVHLTPMVLRR